MNLGVTEIIKYVQYLTFYEIMNMINGIPVAEIRIKIYNVSCVKSKSIFRILTSLFILLMIDINSESRKGIELSQMNVTFCGQFLSC
jgi:hypothetical protein